MNTKSAAGAAVINVTPLIDVLLTLLIIFMVIVPQTPLGFQAEIPQDDHKVITRADTEALVVSLDLVNGTEQYRINQLRVEASELTSRLAVILNTRADHTIFLRADRDLDFDKWPC